jgi:hypothetical protein
MSAGLHREARPEHEAVRVEDGLRLHATADEAHRLGLVAVEHLGRDGGGGARAQRGEQGGVQHGSRQRGVRVVQDVEAHDAGEAVPRGVLGVDADPLHAGRVTERTRHGAEVARVLGDVQVHLGRHARLTTTVSGEGALHGRDHHVHREHAANLGLGQEQGRHRARA